MTSLPTSTPPAPDLARVTLGVLVIGLLGLGSLWILKPFLGAIIWATMLVVATWPAMLSLEARFGGRRWLATTIMIAAMLLVLIVPLTLAATTIVDHADDVAASVRTVINTGFPPPPQWVVDLPMVGQRLAGQWQQLADISQEELTALAAPYARGLAEWFVAQIGGVGVLALQFLLTMVVAGSLYATGETAAIGVRRFARRLAGDRGDQAAVLAAQAIRAVALGIVVTALVQAVAAGIGFAVCGVPYGVVLTALVFALCMVQLGPFFVMLPAAAWLYWGGHPVSAAVLLVWTVVVGVVDNVLRPILIRRGADLPLPLIIAGAIGGVISLGVIGLFVGPVVLAVTYRLLEWWTADIDRAPAEARV